MSLLDKKHPVKLFRTLAAEIPWEVCVNVKMPRPRYVLMLKWGPGWYQWFFKMYHWCHAAEPGNTYLKPIQWDVGSCFFFFFFILFICIFGCIRSSSLSLGFSSCGALASNCGGFSRYRARTLGHEGFSSCGSWALEHRLNSWGIRA